MAAPTILLAWELGGGQGHVQNFRRLATRLRQVGECRIVAAIRDLRRAWHLADAEIEVIQAPAWPGSLGDGERPRRSSATFTDVLASAGLADPDAVLGILQSWGHLLHWIDPDLVVTDYAPLAGLAARGRLPVLQTGIGYTLPPATLDRLPELHRLSPPVWSDEEVLAVINGALRQTGSPLLSRLSKLFAGDDVVVTTFPILDPYANARATPAQGPLLDGIAEPVRSDATGIFAYLWPDMALRTDVRAGLSALGPDLEIFVPGGDGETMADLLQAGATVHWQAPPLSDVLPRRRLVLHQGGAGLAGEALAVGVPQYLLTSHIEQELNARALAAAGVAHSTKMQDPAVRITAEALEEALHDPGLSACARDLGERCRPLLQRDPLSELAKRCLSLAS
jgi:hypothetical protein